MEHFKTLRDNVIRGIMGMMGVSVFIFPVICPRCTSTSSGGSSRSGSVMTVTTVAPKTGVGLSLVESSGGDLVRVSRCVIHRLCVFVFVVEPVSWLGIGIRVLAYLGVNWSVFLSLQTKVIGTVLRVLVLVVGFPGLVFVVSTLTWVVLQGSQNWNAFVWVLFDSKGLGCRHWWHEIRQSMSHRRDGLLLSLTTVVRPSSCNAWKIKETKRISNFIRRKDRIGY